MISERLLNSQALMYIGIICFSIFLVIMSGQSLTIFDEIYATSLESGIRPARLSGPIVSLQFSSDGETTWIVSGRWRIDVNYDSTGMLPLNISNVNVSLVMVSADGEITERFKLSEFKPGSLTFDKPTDTLAQNGTLRITRGNQPISDVGANLKLINRQVIIIGLDPSKTKDYFGSSPIYGVER